MQLCFMGLEEINYFFRTKYKIKVENSHLYMYFFAAFAAIEINN